MPSEIEFTARMEGADVVWDGPDGKPAKDHKFHVAKGAPPETIEFKLKDKTGLSLQFKEEDAFQAWEKQGCPPPGIDTDQIQLLDSKPDKVRVVNLNTGPQRTLQYQLNAVGKDGKEWPCDPIMQNDGGGPGLA
jgi:hypothetical protein